MGVKNNKGLNKAPKRRKVKSPGYRTVKGVTKGAQRARKAIGVGKAAAA
jgi:hypothetical protein